MQDYVAILKGKGIYTNSKQVEEIFSLADRLVLCHSKSKAVVTVLCSDGDSVLSNSELREEMKRLANTETAYNLMDSDR